ncbi:hypothetical protein MAPG_09838 [Magnaporthiopsis poae ATCC 64411]|uniref:Uncharacterized protein n=1 Tax=Magnaporthiopsis poae (strain ATCC 64411 / 73-15) TaxID=644358 RepID=A0A0C4EAZ8_MAGP6|nr:hypothetical protein MAPG_09838 [Magnaporthiopsis poae ATCC 64411]
MSIHSAIFRSSHLRLLLRLLVRFRRHPGPCTEHALNRFSASLLVWVAALDVKRQVFASDSGAKGHYNFVMVGLPLFLVCSFTKFGEDDAWIDRTFPTASTVLPELSFRQQAMPSPVSALIRRHLSALICATDRSSFIAFSWLLLLDGRTHACDLSGVAGQQYPDTPAEPGDAKNTSKKTWDQISFAARAKTLRWVWIWAWGRRLASAADMDIMSDPMTASALPLPVLLRMLDVLVVALWLFTAAPRLLAGSPDFAFSGFRLLRTVSFSVAATNGCHFYYCGSRRNHKCP